MSLHDSKACCTLPPAVAGPYSPKGTFTTLAGLKTYVTGPSSATTAVVFLYDIFGFAPQTLQGADIVATGAGYRVFIPDCLEGNYAKPSYFSPDMPASEEPAKQKFFGGAFNFAEHAERLKGVLAALKEHSPEIRNWAAMGFCWGGKMVAMTSGKDTPWFAGVQSSPAKIDPKDGEKITVPHMVLASGGENADEVQAFEKSMTVENHVETFGSMAHGWMSARGDFEDADKKAAYDRGYQLATDFLRKHTP